MMCVLWAACVAAQSAPVPREAPAPELRWKLKAGDVLVYEHCIERTTRTSMAKKSTERVEKIEATARIEVERVTVEGHFVCRYSLTRMRVTVDGKVEFDSEAPSKGGSPAAAAARTALQRAQSCTFTPLGRSAAERSSAVLPLAVTSLVLPERSASSWQVPLDAVVGPLKLAGETSYRLDAPSGNAPTVVSATTLKLQKEEGALRLRAGSGRQRAVFDADRGMLRTVENEFTLDVEGERAAQKWRCAQTVRTSTALKDRTRK